jgi:hypothetical protein
MKRNRDARTGAISRPRDTRASAAVPGRGELV